MVFGVVFAAEHPNFSWTITTAIAVAQNDMHGTSAIDRVEPRGYARCQPSASKSIGIVLGIDSHVSQAANFTG